MFLYKKESHPNSTLSYIHARTWVCVYISYTQGPAPGRGGTRPAPGPGFTNYREKMAWERAQAAGGAGGNRGGSGGAERGGGREWVSAGGGGVVGGGGGIGYAERMAKQVNPKP